MYNNDLYAGEAEALAAATTGLGRLINPTSPIKLSNISSDLQNLQKGQNLLRFFLRKTVVTLLYICPCCSI